MTAITVRKPTPGMELSLQAVRAARLYQEEGQRGVMVLNDPFTAQMVVFRVTEQGCQALAVADLPPDDPAPPVVVGLPGLTIPSEADPLEIVQHVTLAMDLQRKGLH